MSKDQPLGFNDFQRAENFKLGKIWKGIAWYRKKYN